MTNAQPLQYQILMKNHINVRFECPQCEQEVTLDVFLGLPARWGKPEDSYEAEPAELQTVYCPQCEHEFTDTDIERILEKADESAMDDRIARDEAKADLLREGWRW